MAESETVVSAPVGRRVSGVVDELGAAALEATARQVAAPAAVVGAEASCGSCWAFGATGAASGPIVTAINKTLNGIGFAVERMLDGIDRWLLNFPPSRVTDFLAGALWTARRTLFPVGPSVGMGGTASCVVVKDCSGQDLTGVDLAGQELFEVNFSHAILTEANLAGAAFADVNFSHAILTGANLASAMLVEANLEGANLERANLEWADLHLVNLVGANLHRANLSYAQVHEADMTNADLSKADLSYARISRTVLVNANLSMVRIWRTVFTLSNLLGANLQYTANWETTWSRSTCPDGSVVGTGGGSCIPDSH